MVRMKKEREKWQTVQRRIIVHSSRSSHGFALNEELEGSSVLLCLHTSTHLTHRCVKWACSDHQLLQEQGMLRTLVISNVSRQSCLYTRRSEQRHLKVAETLGFTGTTKWASSGRHTFELSWSVPAYFHTSANLACCYMKLIIILSFPERYKNCFIHAFLISILVRRIWTL